MGVEVHVDSLRPNHRRVSLKVNVVKLLVVMESASDTVAEFLVGDGTGSVILQLMQRSLIDEASKHDSLMLTNVDIALSIDGTMRLVLGSGSLEGCPGAVRANESNNISATPYEFVQVERAGL